ncbi:Cytidylate kinase [subsurface metagenome]
MPKPSIIAIDGPVAAGKSTIGRLLAQRLGYRFLDTGEMYRALTWKALKLNIDLEDEAELSQLASSTEIEFVPRPTGNERYCSVLVDGCDVAMEIHALEVEAGVSLVAKVAGVRRVMVERQRKLAQDGEIVMAGRDIGTTVLPHAELKIYLSASFEERARRRYQEVIERGEMVDYQAILVELMRRDEIDSQRPISPLEPASDARMIDTDGLNPDQVLAEILSMMDW